MPSPYYGMRDPFADINARLRKLGLQPITMGGAPARPDIAAMYQQPLSAPSPMDAQQALKQQAKVAGPMYNQLTPEAEEDVMGKITGGLLSGVEWIGKYLDSVTGARAIRGLLAGRPRELLSFGPGAVWGDFLGITDPKDIVGGRELMEKAGILGRNKPGLDWGDVGGFAAEVLLDPSTYFFGAGLLTKGVQAGTKTGAALGKAGILDDLLQSVAKSPSLQRRLFAGKTDDVSVKMIEKLDRMAERADDLRLGRAKELEESVKGTTLAEAAAYDTGKLVDLDKVNLLGLDKVSLLEKIKSKLPSFGKDRLMGQRQLGHHLTLEDVIRVDDELTTMLKRHGKKLPDEVQALKSSFRGVSGRSVRDVLEESLEGTTDTVKSLLKEAIPSRPDELLPLTSYWSMGFPTLFTGVRGTKGIRQTLFKHLPKLERQQYFPGMDTKFGAHLDRMAGRFDVAGAVIRFGKYSPGRYLAPMFNPALRWNAKTAEAQRSILAKVSKFDRQVAEQKTVLNHIYSKWRRDGLFDEEVYMRPIEDGGFGLDQEGAAKLINKHMDEVMSWQEGYNLRFNDEGMPLSSLPDHDINSAKEIGRYAEINKIQAGNYINSIENQIHYLTEKAPSSKEVIGRVKDLEELKKQANKMHDAYSREVESIRKISEVDKDGKLLGSPEDIGNAIERLKKHKELFSNVEEFAEGIGEVRLPDLETPAFGIERPTPRAPLGGVHHRLNPKFSEKFADHLRQLGDIGKLDEAGEIIGIEGDLIRLRTMADEALGFAKASGIDIDEMVDEFALYRPRSVTDPRPRGLRGAIEKARANRNLGKKMKKYEDALDTGKAENLNPLTYRAQQRREYLKDIFGGTTTLNYFYGKYGDIKFPRIRGERTIPTQIEKDLLHDIASDNYWQHAIGNKEHLDSLLERGLLKKAEVDEIGEFVVRETDGGILKSVPIDESPDVSRAFQTASGEVVYINKKNKNIKKFAQSILAKDSDLAEAGTKLFSVDPIRGMLGYYGDVMKAANAAEIVIDIASENARYQHLGFLKRLALETPDEHHTVAEIFRQTKLDTLIGKRNFLEKLRAESPDEWRFFKEAVELEGPEFQKESPEFFDFVLKGPGALRVGDRVAAVSADYGQYRGKKIIAIVDVDKEGRQIIQRADPGSPTNTPTETINHSQQTKSWESEDLIPESGKLPVREDVKLTKASREPMSADNISSMEEVINRLKTTVDDIEYSPEAIKQLEKTFYDTGVFSTKTDYVNLRRKELLIKNPKGKWVVSKKWHKKLATQMEVRLEAAQEKLAKRLEAAPKDEIQKIAKQADETVAPAARPTLTAGEKVMLEDSLVWDKRNPNSGNYTTKDGGFEIHPERNEAGIKQKGWNLFYLEDNGKTFDWQNDYRLLKDAKAGAKEFQETLKAKQGLDVPDRPVDVVDDVAMESAEESVSNAKILASEQEIIASKRLELVEAIKEEIAEAERGLAYATPRLKNAEKKKMRFEIVEYTKRIDRGNETLRALNKELTKIEADDFGISDEMSESARLWMSTGTPEGLSRKESILFEIAQSQETIKFYNAKPDVTPLADEYMGFITHLSTDGYKKMEAALPPSGHRFIGGEEVGWAGGPVISPDGEVMWSIGNPEEMGGMLENVADSAFPLSHPSARAELADGLKRQAESYKDELKRAIERGPDGDSRIEIFEYEGEIEDLKRWVKEAESGETLDDFDTFVRDVEAARPAQQLAPEQAGDQGVLFTTEGAGKAGIGDEGYKQLQDDVVAPVKEGQAKPPASEEFVPPPTGPTFDIGDGPPGKYMVLENVDNPVLAEKLIHLDEIPNHILNNDEYSNHLLSNFIIDPTLSDDLKQYLNSFVKRDVQHEMHAALVWFTDVFKDMATSLWPAFHFRNFISGQVNNMYSGAYDPDRVGFMKWIQPIRDGMLLAQGKPIKGLQNIPMFKGMTDRQASQAIIDAATGWGLIGPGQHGSDLVQHADDMVANSFLKRTGGPSPVIGREDTSYIGGVKSRFKEAKNLGDEVVGTIPWPGNVAGKALPGFTDSWYARQATGWKRVGFQFGNEVEWLNRVPALIAHLKKGLSMEEAIMKVKLAQVDYRALTPFEKQWFKKIIPFYTFTRRQIPFVLEELRDPSSGMSQMAKGIFRSKKAMEDPAEPTPDWISTGVNLPLHKLGLGGTQPGMARYLTGLGGFIGGPEDVMGLIKPGRGILDTGSRMIAGLGARSNPLIQMLSEQATGYSFFHQRPYSEMKSPTARLLGEVSGSEFIPKWPDTQLDALLHKMPGYGRAVSTARSLLDETRRPVFDEEWKNFSAANLLARIVPLGTGIKLYDTDMNRIKNRLLQDRLEEILKKNPNMIKFSQIYIPQDRLGALSQEELEAYLLYKKLGAAASKASYARRKAAEYSN